MTTMDIIMGAIERFADDPRELIDALLGATCLFLMIPIGLTLAAMFGG